MRQQPPAAGRDRAVDRGEQTAVAPAPERAHQFEIGAGGGIDEHRLPRKAAARGLQRHGLAALGPVEIGEDRREGGKLGGREIPEGLERRHAEMALDPPLGRSRVKPVAGQPRHGSADRLEQCRAGLVVADRIGNQQFGRVEPRQFPRQIGQRNRGDMAFSGGDIDRRDRIIMPARRPLLPRQGREDIGPPGIQQPVLGDRARRHDAHDVAVDDGLGAALAGFRRVLHLLADRDPVAGRDQALEIFVGPHHRHAAHGDIHAAMLAALRQYDAERARGHLGILEEQFVEIAHPVEEQAIRMLRLDLEILRHGRRRPRRLFGRRAPERLLGGVEGGITHDGSRHSQRRAL